MSVWRRSVLIPLTLLALGLEGLAACRAGGPSGDLSAPTPVASADAGVQVQQRPVGGFDRVHVSGVGQLVVTPGALDALSVEAEPEVLPHIRSEVQDGELEIGPAPGTSLSARRPILYRLTASQLRALRLSGAAGARATGLRADAFTLDVDGGGRAELTDLQASDLTVTLSGAADVTVTGTVAQQRITITGSGRYQGQGLRSREAIVSLIGAGLCELWVSDRLDVDLTGAGRVSYLGSPEVHETVVGAGLVTRAG